MEQTYEAAVRIEKRGYREVPQMAPIAKFEHLDIRRLASEDTAHEGLTLGISDHVCERSTLL